MESIFIKYLLKSDLAVDVHICVVFYFVPFKWVILIRKHFTVMQLVKSEILFVFFSFNLLTNTKLIREAAMAFLNMVIWGGLRNLLIN